jgi:hypothetical protein
MDYDSKVDDNDKVNGIQQSGVTVLVEMDQQF